MLKRLHKLVGVVAALCLCAGLAAPAVAADSGRYLDVALLGDSYTAGNGAGSYYGPPKSYRSMKNWGHVYVEWLNQQGVRATVRNLAISGGVTSDVLNRQIPLLDPHTDLVMLTIGGNDIKFEDIVKNCFVLGWRSYSGCESALKYAQRTFPTTRAQIIRVLDEIQRKVADDARIVLVGYPLLSIESNYSVAGWLWGSYPAAQKIREFGQFATQEQRRLVEEWNANPDNKVKVTFVPTEMHFAGHEPDPETNRRNPVRWLNEMLEDEGDYGPDGVIISKSTGLFEVASWYHPNIAGHREIANLLQRYVGVPENVRTERSSARDVDVVFAVETSDVTAPALAEMIAQVRRVINQVSTAASGAGAQARFSLISYRDLPLAGSEAPAAPAASERSAAQPGTAFRSVGAAAAPDTTVDPAPGLPGADEAPAAPAPGAPGSDVAPNDPATGEHTADEAPAASANTDEAPLESVTRVRTFDEAGLEEAMASLVANGPNARTSLYRALSTAMASFDRPSARKVLMVLGDVDSAHDLPEDWDALARQAFEHATVEIVGVDINDQSSELFTSLARRTGGYSTTLHQWKPLITPEPVAVASVPSVVQVGHEVVLDASESVAEGSSIVRYEWDLNDDAVFDIISTPVDGQPPLVRVPYTWDGPVSTTVTLRVFDEFGRMARVSVPVTVTVDGDLIEEGDNCPLHPNPDQADEDRDGIGDVCDPTPHGVEAVSPHPPTVTLPIAEIELVPDTAPTVPAPPNAEIELVPNTAPTVPALPNAEIDLVPNTAPTAPELPSAEIEVVPNTAPTAPELPIAQIEVVPNTAPIRPPLLDAIIEKVLDQNLYAPIYPLPDISTLLRGEKPQAHTRGQTTSPSPVAPRGTPSATPPINAPAQHMLAATGQATPFGPLMAGVLMTLGGLLVWQRRANQRRAHTRTLTSPRM